MIEYQTESKSFSLILHLCQNKNSKRKNFVLKRQNHNTLFKFHGTIFDKKLSLCILFCKVNPNSISLVRHYDLYTIE